MPLSLRPGLTLYFCRHGETEANVVARFQGVGMDTPLTPKGLEQARRIGLILGREALFPGCLAHVSSPLGRARATSEVARATLGLARNAYATEPRLREIDLGMWEGLTAHEAKARFPEAYAARQADKWNVPVPGGESYADVAARAESWIADLARDTFAVSHGAFTRVLRGLFQGLDWRAISALDEPQGVLFRVRGATIERIE